MFFSIIIYLCSVIISSFSQIMLKKSASIEHNSKLNEYLNIRVITAYGLFFISTLVTMYAYRIIPLSLGPILESSGYIWISILSYLFLKERISKMKAVGLVTIIVGILIYTV